MDCQIRTKRHACSVAFIVVVISLSFTIKSTYAYDDDYSNRGTGTSSYGNWRNANFSTSYQAIPDESQYRTTIKDTVPTITPPQETYRPSYVWAERGLKEPSSIYRSPNADVDLGTIRVQTPKFEPPSMSTGFIPFTPVRDSVNMYREFAHNNISSATSDDYLMKGLKATGHDISRVFIEHFPLFSPTSLEEGTVRIINPNTTATEKMLGTIQIAKEAIPLAAKYGGRKLVRNNLDKYITNSTLRTTNIAIAKGLKAMDRIDEIDMGADLATGVYGDKYQSHQFKMPQASIPSNLENVQMPSALLHLNIRVKRLEFYSGFFNGELPIDSSLFYVAIACPS